MDVCQPRGRSQSCVPHGEAYLAIQGVGDGGHAANTRGGTANGTSAAEATRHLLHCEHGEGLVREGLSV